MLHADDRRTTTTKWKTTLRTKRLVTLKSCWLHPWTKRPHWTKMTTAL
jgi:hypothetical protein